MRGFGREALSMERGLFGTEMGMCSMKGNGRQVSPTEKAKFTI